MRARKPKNLDERRRLFADAIVDDPEERAGHWAEMLLPRAREVRLDLGCGKGGFAIESAKAEPDVLFVGVDVEEVCVVLAAQRAIEEGVYNAVFVLDTQDDVCRFFAPGELARIHLNFSAPFPQSKAAVRRLSHAKRLMGYRSILAPDGVVCQKTDSEPLFKFSLTQYQIAGYEPLACTNDLLNEPSWPQANVSTEFEERLCQMGATVHAIIAKPGPAPEKVEQVAPLSLAEYLPEDLESMSYIPLGMEDTVRNLLNRRANLARKAELRAKNPKRHRPRKTAAPKAPETHEVSEQQA